MGLNLKDNFRTRESAFSYHCHACNKCCHGKGIQVNPYETMRLSGLLGITTTEFRQKYLNRQMLKHKPDSDACIFLGENGCTVHKDRPLVCRLYPLGRLRLDTGREIFTELAPHPESKGEYGTSSIVEGYLQTQEVESYLQAEKSYSELITQMANAALSGNVQLVKSRSNKKKIAGFSYTDWILDPDPLILQYCNMKKIEFPMEIQKKLELHIEAIYAWVQKKSSP
jgi:Fe-S-cluster containining protein